MYLLVVVLVLCYCFCVWGVVVCLVFFCVYLFIFLFFYFCNNKCVVDEVCVLIECAMYTDLRFNLRCIASLFNRDYVTLNNVQKKKCLVRTLFFIIA